MKPADNAAVGAAGYGPAIFVALMLLIGIAMCTHGLWW